MHWYPRILTGATGLVALVTIMTSGVTTMTFAPGTDGSLGVAETATEGLGRAMTAPRQAVVAGSGAAPAGAVAVSGSAAQNPPANNASKDKKPQPITIRGGYVNDLNCIPLGASPTPDLTVYKVDCDASSLWNGDLTGREIVRLHGTITTSGEFDGTYVGVFVGTYAGDHSYGGLTTKGRVRVDKNGQFSGEATIVGTCGWAGSSGSMTYFGYMVNGGFEGQWSRPAQPPAADPTCNPIDPKVFLP